VLRAQVNGVDFLGADELYAQLAFGVLAIAARASDGRTIHITVVSKLVPETVQVGPGSPNSAITAHGPSFWRSNVAGGSGTVTIKNISFFGADGTFTFTGVAVPNTEATGTRTVKGRFNVEYGLSDDQYNRMRR